MATKPTAAIARLLAANNNAYDVTTNPGGLAEGGHRQNFPPDLQAVVDVGQWTEDLAGEVEDNAAAVETARAQAVAKAGEASDSATAAAGSATASANSAAALVATSSTSLAIGTGSKVFTTQPGKQFGLGSRLAIADTASPSTRIMYGNVTAYTGTSLTVLVDNVVGSGTFANWKIGISGDRGSLGPAPFSTPVDWASGVAYVVGPPASAVVYNGESYVCILGHTSSGSIPPTNATYWQKIAAKGASPGPSAIYDINLMYGS